MQCHITSCIFKINNLGGCCFNIISICNISNQKFGWFNVILDYDLCGKITWDIMYEDDNDVDFNVMEILRNFNSDNSIELRSRGMWPFNIQEIIM